MGLPAVTTKSVASRGVSTKPQASPLARILHCTGHYAISGKASSSMLSLTRRSGGAGKYTDKLKLQFSSKGSSCIVHACSASQVNSIKDCACIIAPQTQERESSAHLGSFPPRAPN